jgi:hypothetical protein
MTTTLACPANNGPVGPMTTPFTMPLDCGFPIPFDFGDNQPSGSCAPPFWADYIGCTPLGKQYYSPGVCPLGYITVGTTVPYWISVTLLPGESIATCCPP